MAKNGQSNYRLDVTNFGPIAQASVEFRPLTVFVGPSNTGKSYLAVLVYALHRCLSGESLELDGFRRRFTWFLPPDKASNAFLAEVKAWLQSSGESSAAPATLVKRFRGMFERSPSVRAALMYEIGRCFGVDDLSLLSRRGRPGTDANIRLSTALEPKNQIDCKLMLGTGETQLAGLFPDPVVAKLLESLRNQPLHRDGLIDDVDSRFFIADMVEDAVQDRLGAAGCRAYYLPADRTGVMHSHQVVVGTLVQSATTAGLRPSTDIPMLSGVLADFLNQLILFGGPYGRRRRAKKKDPSASFEENLLQGSVHLQNTETNYPSFTYRPADWDEELPLMRTSSMVSELAPVVLYLRYLVEAGDVLIIEEPEAHLHPAMQTKLARELAHLVRSGVRIVLTTHSEWLLEQIGNIVALSEVPAEERADIAGSDVALHPHEVGAWLFKPKQRPKGSVVEEIKLNPETGTFPTDYDDVSQALYNEGATIYNRVQERKEAPSA